MKQILTVIFCLAFSTVFCQKDLTKVAFKIYAECKCTFQVARADTPTHQVFKLFSDTMAISIDRETTGFYFTCGESNPMYVRVPYRPGEGIVRIAVSIPCTKEYFGTIIFIDEPVEEII